MTTVRRSGFRPATIFLFLLAACTSPAPEDTGSGASINILSPAEDAEVCGTPLRVETAVEGLILVDPYAPEEDPEPGTGHIDLMLNGQDAVMGGAESLEVPDVADGVWQLKVELSNADHTPVQPYAGDFLYITVTEAACSSSR